MVQFAHHGGQCAAGTDVGQATYADYVALPDDGLRHDIIGGAHYVTASPVTRHPRHSGVPTRLGLMTRETLVGSSLAAVAIAVCLLTGAVSGQQAEHLNSVVDALARGERVYGVSTYDLSLENSRSLARADIDYVYVDMEHGPMDFAALQTFLLGMTDKRAIAESGSLRANVTPLARIAPYGRESAAWAVKQALDIGLMGLIFPAIETPDQALAAVRAMRYPQRRDSRYPEPPGLRGSGAAIGSWFWGLSGGDYFLHADTWPLNPDGDLLALMMIESIAGGCGTPMRLPWCRAWPVSMSARAIFPIRSACRGAPPRSKRPFGRSSTPASRTTSRAASRRAPPTCRGGSRRGSRFSAPAVPVAA